MNELLGPFGRDPVKVKSIHSIYSYGFSSFNSINHDVKEAISEKTGSKGALWVSNRSPKRSNRPRTQIRHRGLKNSTFEPAQLISGVPWPGPGAGGGSQDERRGVQSKAGGKPIDPFFSRCAFDGRALFFLPASRGPASLFGLLNDHRHFAHDGPAERFSCNDKQDGSIASIESIDRPIDRSEPVGLVGQGSRVEWERSSSK